MTTLLVTGGCGFIGSNLVKLLRAERPDWKVVTLDKLTYAGNLENLRELEGDDRHLFVRGGIENRELVEMVLREQKVDAVLHLAAESHVDRSILGPEVFIQTNVLGTQVLLDASRAAGVKSSPYTVRKTRSRNSTVPGTNPSASSLALSITRALALISALIRRRSSPDRRIISIRKRSSTWGGVSFIGAPPPILP
jgi:NAD(P)-dependent dehydrogenase (short-subunit alcohol dehydrogenase family)